MALWEEINTQSIDQTFILYVNHDCKQRANCGGSTVKRLSRIRSSKTLLHHIRDGKEDTPNPPITWSELTAVTVAADNCAILKDDRQTPEDTSHTRTVCEKYVIQSTLKQCHSQNEKIFSRYKSAQFFYILISIYTLSFNLARRSYFYLRVTYAHFTSLQDPLWKIMEIQVCSQYVLP